MILVPVVDVNKFKNKANNYKYLYKYGHWTPLRAVSRCREVPNGARLDANAKFFDCLPIDMTFRRDIRQVVRDEEKRRLAVVVTVAKGHGEEDEEDASGDESKEMRRMRIK